MRIDIPKRFKAEMALGYSSLQTLGRLPGMIEVFEM
jgi:hypothetical protein